MLQSEVVRFILFFPAECHFLHSVLWKLWARHNPPEGLWISDVGQPEDQQHHPLGPEVCSAEENLAYFSCFGA